MTHYYLIKGYIEGEGKTKFYIKKVIGSEGNEIVTYHNFKKKVSRWGNKYGAYNTIIRKSGTATFYNVGKAIDGKFVLRRFVMSIDNKTIALGYNY
jgi:hypothetical protein